MSLEKQIAQIFKLKGDSWLKHANPLSVWTRFLTLPFLVLAIWSRVWISWYCLIPITVIIVWLIINPTLFKKPKKFDNWASKSVLGERYWSERKENKVPNQHNTLILILTILQIIGVIVLIVGLWKLRISLTIIGMVMIYLSKMWFLDRMVWIYEDMKKRHIYSE
ncbi:MAG: hypothetical protein CR982_06685 [Candidatus Cloacimonadota bacterium]|nr:MAG: hypothetical protein CR982_06685 [Candidatus Cloacimonadota bacterium]PIE77831.1 MAG: hypothetical protein CSA15_11080 [Candidatus Delongbacteria bacterium]